MQNPLLPSPPFRPWPFLGNPHVQTYLGSLTWDCGKDPPTREHQVLLPDGDSLVLHDSVPTGWNAGRPMALLVHGLGGSHRSGGVRRLAQKCWQGGWRAVRLDLRGAGSGEGLARKAYNAGCSEDVRAVLAEMHAWAPASPLAAVGLSLGGNIVLKLAGEAVDRPVPGLACVVSVSAPLDLEACTVAMSRPENHLYDTHYVRHLLTLVRRQQYRFPDLPAVAFPRQMTLRLFDDLFTAPRAGYVDALDYYRRASALPFIPRIQIPGLILTARDDPFVPADPLANLHAPLNLEVCITGNGGHLGFVGYDGAGGFRWVERRVLRWLEGNLGRLNGPPRLQESAR